MLSPCLTPAPRAVTLGKLSIACITLLAAAQLLAGEPRTAERLDRGIVAVRTPEGFFIGWRLLATDPPDIAFHVYRQHGNQEPVRLTSAPLRQATCFLDRDRDACSECRWSVAAVADGRERSCGKPVTAWPKPYRAIRLRGRYTFQKVGLADLDGNGRLDFVIKQPDTNVDPYVRYWKPSPGTYRLEAYADDGRFLWQVDLGWAIEQGIWYSPYVVYDLDGDGRAEVAVKTGEGDPRDRDGRVQRGPEYLTILDGMSGTPVERIAWPDRRPFYEIHGRERGYNYASRNQLGIAYLDGTHPHLIVERGTYGYIVVIAYRFDGKRLRTVWRWDNRSLPRNCWGQGAHWMHGADVDEDGRDEVIIGSLVIDDNGTTLWTTGRGHPDHVYVGDIDPLRAGLEIYYGLETRQRRGGMCLVDAATGRMLWGYDGPTRHVHGRGMCSDIDPAYPGSECYSADTDARKRYAWSRLWSAQGKVIGTENLGGFGPLTAYWDGDPQRELLLGRTIRKYRGGIIGAIEGKVVAVADIVGDWREELIVTAPGELRIYTTTLPTPFRHTTLLQDPIYRIDVAHASMGYHQVPMLSFDLASRIGAATAVDRDRTR